MLQASKLGGKPVATTMKKSEAQVFVKVSLFQIKTYL